MTWSAIPIVTVGWLIWWHGQVPRRSLVVLLAAGFFVAAATLASDTRRHDLEPDLRTTLDRQFGGFRLEAPGPGGRHSPILTRALLREDGSDGGDSATLRAAISELQLNGRWVPAPGGTVLSVGGSPALRDISAWRAGRRIEAPVTFRRPARYLDDGVRDFEADLALDGTALFGSIKSGLLVQVTDRGNLVQETAARIRASVRRQIGHWIGAHDALAAAIVTAVLIGDRTGLPDTVRLRLQSAGTYHVIAISGGNIAILAGLSVGTLLLCGVTGRPSAVITLVLLVGYAELVTSSASVWRATLMAGLYLGARLLDHRSAPWHAIAIAAAVVVCARPLDVRDAGFLLTFGATAGADSQHGDHDEYEGHEDRFMVPGVSCYLSRGRNCVVAGRRVGVFEDHAGRCAAEPCGGAHDGPGAGRRHARLQRGRRNRAPGWLGGVSWCARACGQCAPGRCGAMAGDPRTAAVARTRSGLLRSPLRGSGGRVA
jgi:predicted membrane metal-binding protein